MTLYNTNLLYETSYDIRETIYIYYNRDYYSTIKVCYNDDAKQTKLQNIS
jgi:hypothetical protein